MVLHVKQYQNNKKQNSFTELPWLLLLTWLPHNMLFLATVVKQTALRSICSAWYQYNASAIGEVMYAKRHLRNAFTLLSRFVMKIIYILQEPKISLSACKSQLQPVAIMSLYQCNIFIHPYLFHITTCNSDSSNLLFNLFLTFQIMLPVICLHLFLDYSSDTVLRNCVCPSWSCEYWIQTKLFQDIFLEMIKLHSSTYVFVY